VTGARRGVGPAWTRAEDLVAVIRRRWETGTYLRAYATGQPWQPITLPIKGPDAGDLLGRLDDCRAWAARIEREAALWTLTYRDVRGRQLGANRIPARATADSFEQLCRILGTEGHVKTLDAVIDATRAAVPSLIDWIHSHPMVAIRHADVWEQVLSTVHWIAGRDTSGSYLRHIDVDGVDTKFVEQHYKLLDQLLTIVVPEDRVGTSAATFALRFGFLEKPSYTRFRILDPEIVGGSWGFSEMSVRSEELGRRDPGASRVYVVENEVTYLAFPAVPGGIVVFGSGFALGGVAALPWLGGKEVIYWGDIDTHGFDILNRLRSHLPSVRSILMDRHTFVAHSRQWVTEPSQTTRAMAHLEPEESAMYRDLVEGTYGPSLRLEQERVRFSSVTQALGRPVSTRRQLFVQQARRLNDVTTSGSTEPGAAEA
jgi:hypothetical protein